MIGMIDGRNIEDNSIPPEKIIGGAGGVPAGNVTYTLTGAATGTVSVNLGDPVTIPTVVEYSNIHNIPDAPKLGEGIQMQTPGFPDYAAWKKHIFCPMEDMNITEASDNSISINVDLNTHNKYIIGISPSAKLEAPGGITLIDGNVPVENSLGMKWLENTIWLYSSPELIKRVFHTATPSDPNYDVTYIKNDATTITGYRKNINGVATYYDANGTLLGTDSAAEDAAIYFFIQAKNHTSHIYGAPYTGMINNLTTDLVGEDQPLPTIPPTEFDLVYTKNGTPGVIWGAIKIEITNDNGVFKYKFSIIRKGESLTETLKNPATNADTWGSRLSLDILVYDLQTGEFIL